MNKNIPFNQQLPETRLAVEAAIIAGKTVMNVYNQEFSSTLKNDNEPLTEADVKSNQITQKIIFHFSLYF